MSEPVPGQVQHVLLPIPQREREHPIELGKRVANTPFGDDGQHHFGVGVPSEGVAAPLELRTEGAEVIDLAVKHDDVASRGRVHRLVAKWREINDGEASVAERDSGPAVEPRAGIVRSAVA